MHKSLFFRPALLASVLVTALLLSNCSAQKPWYHERVQNWADTPAPSGDLSYSLFLIGDAGKSSKDHPEPTFDLLNTHVNSAKKDACGVIWLGDNLYPDGLVAEDDESRAECERRLKVQVDAVAQGAGTLVFLPGNHDWEQGGKDGYNSVLRAEKFIEGYANRGNIWLPDDGCPGPVEVPLSEDVVLLILDTQWWLHKHDKPENCAASSKDEFVEQVRSRIAANQGKKIIVAAHHPLYSYGAHGGRFPASTHLFPLLMAKKNLYVPLPVLGTAGVLYRKVLGNIQDIPNPKYSDLRDRLTEVFSSHPDLIYAAGHDHCLQYLPIENQHHIVSGAGCKTRWTGHGKQADFTYAHKGFCRVNFYKDDAVWMEFWVPVEENESGKMVFRKRLF